MVTLDSPVLRRIRRYSDARARPYGLTGGALEAPVAQWIEQQPSNLSVPGSNPGGGALRDAQVRI
jgi:hypothetical protein